METPEIPGNTPCPDQGTVYIELGLGLDAVWTNNGEQGSGFVLESSGALSWTGTGVGMSIEGLNLALDTPYALTARYLPDPGALECSFDLSHIGPLGKTVGGERFTYSPNAGALYEGGILERTPPNSGTALAEDQNIKIYPVPVRDHLQIEFGQWDDATALTILVFDVFGKLRLQQIVPKGKNARLDVRSLTAGLYFLKVDTSADKNIGTRRFIKY